MRRIIITCLVGISLGTWIMFGIDGGFGLHAEVTGQYALSQAADPQAGLFELFGTLPLGKVILPIAFALATLGFLATSLDSASFTLAASATAELDGENGNPNSKFRTGMVCSTDTGSAGDHVLTGAPFSAP